jgi:hypothetical protein
VLIIDIVFASIFVALIVGFPAGALIINLPETFHPSRPMRTACRQVKAMRKWKSGHAEIVGVYHRAQGYLAARDYLGVESAYAEARRIVDGEKP